MLSHFTVLWFDQPYLQFLIKVCQVAASQNAAGAVIIWRLKWDVCSMWLLCSPHWSLPPLSPSPHLPSLSLRELSFGMNSLSLDGPKVVILLTWQLTSNKQETELWEHLRAMSRAGAMSFWPCLFYWSKQ